jgi:hypothetical protein
MQPLTFLCGAALLVGCSKTDNRVTGATGRADTGMTPSVQPTASPTISLADFAGKWNTHATNEAGTVVGEAVVIATADTSGWTLNFPKQKPIPMRVIAVAGDSVVTEVGPYASFQRKGAQVRSRAVNRLQNGKLVASLEGHYIMAGRDSVVHLRVEGTREP